MKELTNDKMLLMLVKGDSMKNVLLVVACTADGMKAVV